MQLTGYLLINDSPVLVLVRTTKTSHSLKIREGGQLGNKLSDEEAYLAENPDIAKCLLEGEVIKL